MSATAMNADGLHSGSEATGTGGWRAVTAAFYRMLGLLACLAMVAAFVTVGLGVIARQAGFDIPGLDAYAGYSIAAALFLALPMTLQRGDHIRVGLVLGKLPPRARNVFEYWSLVAGLALALYVAYYACRLVWVSHATHDVSQSIDATPLWIPQLAMALGSIGFAVAFAEALIARLQGRGFFAAGGSDAARAE
ncbi:TRAP transporter small permease [Piscinibacter sp.]|uniref:TRAP transporter small permease n=1 Tax=Piscinibacter sp. TaxID=1903157 RepID=UPI002CF243EB|nr:TRAP transporter small permease [Albitalea sp.]HUG25128.1 TRAP transporter small permease [Albitalea sp.]